MSARKAVDSVLTDLERVRDTVAPFPSCVVGSAVLAAYHEDLATPGIDTTFNDVDVFTNEESYFMLMGALFHKGYKSVKNYERTPVRQLSRGFGGWKTNSLKLEHPQGFEVNIICKFENRVEVDDLYSVLLSFDWGGLLMGYDEFGVFHDLRSAVFPDVSNDDYGMVPARAATIGKGYMGEYIAARMFGRVAKLGSRGYTIDAFAKQVNDGYAVLSAHYQGFPDAKHQALASFYHDVQQLIDKKDWQQLDDVSRALIGLGDGSDDEAQFAADIEALI
jgi:hypothetical protein